jgi:hypothetical protein
MNKNNILLLLSALVFLLLVVRLLHFTEVYAVNMIFLDEWAFFDPMFRHGSLWEAFDYQHGPHRMGIGALISNALMEISVWNTKWNSFAVAAAMIFSAAMGVAVCIRAGCRAWLSLLSHFQIYPAEGVIDEKMQFLHAVPAIAPSESVQGVERRWSS